MSDEGQREKLRVFDEMLARVPARSPREVEVELRAIRRARRQTGRRHPVR